MLPKWRHDHFLLVLFWPSLSPQSQSPLTQIHLEFCPSYNRSIGFSTFKTCLFTKWLYKIQYIYICIDCSFNWEWMLLSPWPVKFDSIFLEHQNLNRLTASFFICFSTVSDAPRTRAEAPWLSWAHEVFAADAWARIGRNLSTKPSPLWLHVREIDSNYALFCSKWRYIHIQYRTVHIKGKKQNQIYRLLYIYIWIDNERERDTNIYIYICA